MESHENERDEEEDEHDDDERVFEEQWMVAAQIGPNKSLPAIELGRRDVNINNDWNEATR